MGNAEQKVKAVYPNAELRFDFVSPVTRWTWYSNKSHDYGKSFLANGIWVNDRCIVFGGKFEFELCRRAWKQIKKDMLKKLES